ncbi:MAG: hypothetical protein Q4F65_11980 [Propionibacteriaceae bacterium]|nr:hypothetical protein [Propionibacteriaceae bacterium]
MTTLTHEPATGPVCLDTQPTTARGDQLPSGQPWSDARVSDAGGSDFPTDQTASAPRSSGVGGATTSPQSKSAAAPNYAATAGNQTDDRGQVLRDALRTSAPVVTNQGQPARSDSPPKGRALADPTLALAADVLDDLERVKIANQNRLRSLTRDSEDSDGEVRGFGLSPDHPDVARLAALVQMLEKAEHDAVLNLQRAMRKHPLGPWVKAQRGVGEKQAARLLATIGDPCINGATGQYRTVSQLWAYCGLHVLPAGRTSSDTQRTTTGGVQTATGGDLSHVTVDAHPQGTGVAARRTKGQRANWSTLAKTRAWLIVEACMKQLDAACKTDTGIAEHVEGCTCSPYRVVVDKRRQHTATTHPEWTPGHSLNDGMRVASKRLLRDLWREARRLHCFHQEDQA